MSILFVLLTFLLIMAVTYLTRRGSEARLGKEAPAFDAPMPEKLHLEGYEAPRGYAFHPGHSWIFDEGRQNGRVGVDAFAANLLGKIDRVEVAGLNRWVRQGQKLATLTREGMSIDLLSPVEGVVTAVNPAVLHDPDLAARDPYRDGWICVVKAPDLALNSKNLIQGTMVLPWMKHSLERLSTMVSQPALAMADGGVPVSGVLLRVDPQVRQKIMKEFLLA